VLTGSGNQFPDESEDEFLLSLPCSCLPDPLSVPSLSLPLLPSLSALSLPDCCFSLSPFPCCEPSDSPELSVSRPTTFHSPSRRSVVNQSAAPPAAVSLDCVRLEVWSTYTMTFA